MTRSNDSGEIDDTRGRNFLTPGWVAAGAVTLVVIIGLVIILVWGRGNPSAADVPPAGAGSVVPTTTPTPTPSPETGQNVPAGWTPCSHVDQARSSVDGKKWEEFNEAPKTTWRDLDGQKLPTTAGGPFKYEERDGGTLAECYTPDALGALTALAQIQLRANSKPGYRAVRLNQTMPGSPIHEMPEHLDQLKKPWGQVAGFRFLTPIQDNTTTIIFQMAVPPNKYYFPIAWEMQWTGTDWKVGRGVHVYAAESESDAPELTHWDAG